MFRAAAVWVVVALAAAVLAALIHEPADDGFGAADLEAMLGDSLDPVVVADAVGGFGKADVTDADGGCERIRFEMATTMDNLELNEALSLWVESAPGSAVESADGDHVTLRRCP